MAFYEDLASHFQRQAINKTCLTFYNHDGGSLMDVHVSLPWLVNIHHGSFNEIKVGQQCLGDFTITLPAAMAREQQATGL